MNKSNFLNPNKDNLQLYLYTGSFLVLLSILDVFFTSFLKINLTLFYCVSCTSSITLI